MLVKELIFDVDNTLYDFEVGHAAGMHQMELYIQEHFQIPPAEFHKIYDRLFKETEERLGPDNAAIHSRSIRIQNMLEEWGKPLYPHLKKLYQVYWDQLLKCSVAEPGCLACISSLKEMGVSVGIGTNMTTWMQYEKMEVIGVLPLVDHIVTSQEAGVEKPSAAFMELCVKKSGVTPEECLFVGDSFERDVAGALAAGMRAVWYNPKKNKLPEEFTYLKGQYGEIGHFDQLISYVQKLG